MKNELIFEISNFKSIQNASVTLRKGLNILVGPNGAGKTCIFSAIRFIKDVVQLGAALAIAKAGGPKRAYHHHKDEIEIKLIFDYGLRTYKRKKYPCLGIWQFTIMQEGEEGIAIVRKESVRIVTNIESKKVELFSILVNRTQRGGNRFSSFLAESEEYGRDLFGIWDKENEFSQKNKNGISSSGNHLTASGAVGAYRGLPGSTEAAIGKRIELLPGRRRASM